MIKQLNRHKYEAIDYRTYDKVKKIFLDPVFDPLLQVELDASQQNATDFPPLMCLQLLERLQVLVLSQNKITRFDGKLIAKHIQSLEILDLSNNLIEQLDDIVDMNLPSLRILEFQGNYVCTYLQRITQIELLLCPKSYDKYDPVKILTSEYNPLPICRLKNDQRTKAKISKYSHKNTLGRFALEICPIPRVTRYPNLEYLNGQEITKLDVTRVCMRNYKEVLVVVKREQLKQRNLSKIHLQYLNSYKKRISRMLEETPSKDPNAILQVQVPKSLDPKKFSVWEVPLDVQYRDAEFSIGVEDLKAENRAFENHQHDKEQKRRQKQLTRIQKKYPDFEVDSDEEHEFYEKRFKGKMDVSNDDERNYRSSETSLNEDVSASEQNFSEESVEVHVPRRVPTASTTDLKSKLKKETSQIRIKKQVIKKIENNFMTVQIPQQQTEKPPSPLRIVMKRSMTPPKIESPIMLETQPIPAQRILTKIQHDQNRSSFDIHNKIFVQHPIVSEKDIFEQKMSALSLVKKPEYVEPPPKIEVVKIHQEKPKKNKKPKPPKERELVKLHGDIDKLEYTRANIPLEELIPQQIDPMVKQEFLFDVTNQTHRDLVHFKGVIEESRNLREMCKEMNEKLEILGAPRRVFEPKMKEPDYSKAKALNKGPVQKIDEKRLRRIEMKEIERAQSYAQLAYHYQKLKKYLSEEQLENYVKMMGINIEAIIQENNPKGMQYRKKKVVNQLPQRITIQKVQQKEHLTQNASDAALQKHRIISAQKSTNQIRMSNIKQEVFSPQSHMQQNHPHLVKFYNEREKRKQELMTKIQKHMISFEEMVELNLRKMQDRGSDKPIEIEEQMNKYAKEFKEKIKDRERLTANVKQHIQDTRMKLDEFFVWDAKEREAREDRVQIILRALKSLEENA